MKKSILAVTLLASLFSASAMAKQSACFITGPLVGEVTRTDGTVEPDGFSGGIYAVVSEHNPHIKGWDSSNCAAFKEGDFFGVICKGEGRTDTLAFDLDATSAFFVRETTGFGMFDGEMIATGSVVSKNWCDI